MARPSQVCCIIEMQAGNKGNRGNQHHELADDDAEPADGDGLSRSRRTNGIEVGPEDKQSQVDQRRRQSDHREYLDMLLGIEQRLNDKTLHKRSHDEEQHDGRYRGDVRMQPQMRIEQVDRVHSDHQELAVGKVDDPHDTENQGQADADDRVNAAEQDAVDQELDENFHRKRLSCLRS